MDRFATKLVFCVRVLLCLTTDLRCNPNPCQWCFKTLQRKVVLRSRCCQYKLKNLGKTILSISVIFQFNCLTIICLQFPVLVKTKFTVIYLKQNMFLGYIMLQQSVVTFHATRNVISHVKCSVHLHQYVPKYVRSAQYGCFM